MNQYIERLKSERTTHERRQIALRVAGVMTALIFVAWLATLGARLANQSAQASKDSAAQTAAAAASAVQVVN